MKIKKTKTPIVIIGAGPTGLVLAIDLANQGVPFRIFDKNLSPSQQSKALGIQVGSLELFGKCIGNKQRNE